MTTDTDSIEGEGSSPVACSPLTVEMVLIALRAMAEQEDTTRRCLTGPRDAPDEFTAWYAAKVLREAARLIEANTQEVAGEALPPSVGSAARISD